MFMGASVVVLGLSASTYYLNNPEDTHNKGFSVNLAESTNPLYSKNVKQKITPSLVVAQQVYPPFTEQGEFEEYESYDSSLIGKKVRIRNKSIQKKPSIQSDKETLPVSSPAQRMSQGVVKLAETGGSDLVEVIIRYHQMPNAENQISLEAIGGTIKQKFNNIPIQLVQIPAYNLEQVASFTGIEFLSINSLVQAASKPAHATAKLPSPNSAHYVPVDLGVAVAVLDSGLGQHSDLNVQSRVDCTTPAGNAGETFRDQFNTDSYSNNNGTSQWNSNWIENDVAGAGPYDGQIVIYNGEMSLWDRPNTGTEPSLAREVNLSGVSTATFSFDYHTTSGVDTSDSVVVEVSSDGGASWSELENFTGISGATTGTRSYNISDHIASNTRVRFRVNNLYGGSNEEFLVDNVDISTDGGVSCSDVNVTVNNVVDHFDSTSYTNSDGLVNWSDNPWIETGDDNSSDDGDINVEVDECPLRSSRCIEFDADTGLNASIERQVDLSAANTATLTFDYHLDDKHAEYLLEVSIDGGASWESNPLATFKKEKVIFGESIDLTPYISEQTRIRFRLTETDDDAHLYIDNVKIEWTVSNFDGSGHGTHVAGIIGADGNSQPGIAPGASIYSVRVLNADGQGYTSDVIEGLDWILDNAESENIRVVNLSLGKGIEESAATDPLVQAVSSFGMLAS